MFILETTSTVKSVKLEQTRTHFLVCFSEKLEIIEPENQREFPSQTFQEFSVGVLSQSRLFTILLH